MQKVKMPEKKPAIGSLVKARRLGTLYSGYLEFVDELGADVWVRQQGKWNLLNCFDPRSIEVIDGK
jgi:hypothetical protein